MTKNSEIAIPEDMNPWTYAGTTVEIIPEKTYGFVYLITNLVSGRMYVGRKYFTLKQGKKRVESDWKKYCGSCKPLLDDMKLLGLKNFKREMIGLYETRGQVNYGEVEEQIKRNVLKELDSRGSRLYYNGNIMCRWYAKSESVSSETKKKTSESVKKSHAEKKSLGTDGGWHHSDESKEKLRSAALGNKRAAGSVRTVEMKEKYSQSKIGIAKTADHKAKLSVANTGKKQSEETKAKRKETMRIKSIESSDK